MSDIRWKVHSRVEPDLLGHLCQIRGIKRTELEVDFHSHLHDPNLLPGISVARQLMVKAKEGNWPVTIFGDYDADGTPAAALLFTVLNRLGLNSTVIIPTRAEGYGLKVDDVERIAKQSKLLILVDTGVTAVEPIRLLKEKGVEIIVLDHHLPAAELPATDALVDPYLPRSNYPFKDLCGCALAYKFATAVAQDFPKLLSEGFLKWLLDLVAISTVADMMIMKGENRVLVHYGLEVLKKTRRPGLRALMATSGIDPERMSTYQLGYALGPRLNATGRLGDNRPAFDLLVSDSYPKALKLSQEIEQSNRARQQLVEETLQSAQDLLFKQNSRSDRCLIIAGENWQPGVVGLVAGKIASQFNRPTVVLAKQGDSLTGSARSAGDYSIIDGLISQRQFLLRFGGHRQAAGMSVEPNFYPQFVDGLKAHATENIPASALTKTYLADAVLADEEILLSTVDLCDQLQPFGIQNQAPLFIIKNVLLGPARLIGVKGDHVKWKGRKGDLSLDVIGFGLANRAAEKPLEEAHLLGHLEKNLWNDQTRLQFRLLDFQPPSKSFEEI